jgi:hypothetical protein
MSHRAAEEEERMVHIVCEVVQWARDSGTCGPWTGTAAPAWQVRVWAMAAWREDVDGRAERRGWLRWRIGGGCWRCHGEEGVILAADEDWGEGAGSTGQRRTGGEVGWIFFATWPRGGGGLEEPGRAREVGWGQGEEWREARGEVARWRRVRWSDEIVLLSFFLGVEITQYNADAHNTHAHSPMNTRTQTYPYEPYPYEHLRKTEHSTSMSTFEGPSISRFGDYRATTGASSSTGMSLNT